MGLVALVLSLTATASIAESPNIAVVDVQKIMQQSPQMKAISEKLEKKFKPRRDQIVKMEENLKKDMEKYNRDASVLSESQKKTQQKKLQEARMKLEQEGQKYQQELNAAHNKELKNLFDKVSSATTKVAKENHYNVVLRKGAAIYVADKNDITDKVASIVK